MEAPELDALEAEAKMLIAAIRAYRGSRQKSELSQRYARLGLYYLDHARNLLDIEDAMTMFADARAVLVKKGKSS